MRLEAPIRRPRASGLISTVIVNGTTLECFEYKVPDQMPLTSHRIFFWLVEGNCPDAQGTSSRGVECTGYSLSLALPTIWCACETLLPRFQRCKSGPTRVSGSIKLDLRTQKHRRSERATSLTIHKQKENTLSISFSAAYSKEHSTSSPRDRKKSTTRSLPSGGFRLPKHPPALRYRSSAIRGRTSLSICWYCCREHSGQQIKENQKHSWALLEPLGSRIRFLTEC
jgi:hypothetical protein